MTTPTRPVNEWRNIPVTLIDSYGVTWNTTLLMSVLLGVFTATRPVVAPAGTVALM